MGNTEYDLQIKDIYNKKYVIPKVYDTEYAYNNGMQDMFGFVEEYLKKQKWSKKKMYHFNKFIVKKMQDVV